RESAARSETPMARFAAYESKRTDCVLPSAPVPDRTRARPRGLSDRPRPARFAGTPGRALRPPDRKANRHSQAAVNADPGARRVAPDESRNTAAESRAVPLTRTGKTGRTARVDVPGCAAPDDQLCTAGRAPQNRDGNEP